ncbi:MAG: glycerol-3-phosphate 1-O-acyltransferase PlsB [Burkholderiaceae bacterium]|nr:glycerol-3-phosphate 1-O-acyltransferase PlsB [Burkholderiaceae bacterium]
MPILTAPKRALLALLRRALRLFVRYRVAPEDPAALAIDRSRPVCYALHIRQLSAYLVLDEAAHALGLPSPSAPLVADSLSERSAFFFLTRTGQPSPLRRNPYRYSRRLERLVAALRRDPALDVQLVPVSVFWGRAPMRQDSVLGALLADSWERPGMVRQFLRLLMHGRDTQLSFGEPISLRGQLDAATPTEPGRDATTRRVARLLRARFRHDRELAVGPNLSHRDTLLNVVVESDAVRREIREQVAARAAGERLDAAAIAKATETAELQARRFAYEIASDYSYPVIRACERALNVFWSRVYDGIEVHRFECIAQAGAGASIVYLPCHRSHVDYLVLSYVILQRGMSPPHVAAGANLNVALLGPILRRGGAFFLRRSFRGEPLFAAVFREYLHAMIRRGHPIEYFVEGGRSRTGRMLTPRTGMLAMTLESQVRDANRPLLFVPVWIGYEKLVEGDSYVAELSGAAKKRESVLGLLRAIRDLRTERFGTLHLNIGEPIRLDEFLGTRWPGWRDSSAPGGGAGDDDAIARARAVELLAREVAVRINDALVVNPVNLVALAVRGLPRRATDATGLARRIDLMRDLLAARPHSARQTLTEADGRASIRHASELGLVEIVADPYGEIVRVSQRQEQLLSNQANNVLHAFALPSLLACVVLRRGRIAGTALAAIIARFQPLIRIELYIGWSDDETARRVDGMLEAMHELALLRRDGERWHPPAPGSAESGLLESLARLMRQTLERHLLVIKILVHCGTGILGAGELERRAIGIARRLSLVHEGSGPDFADRASIASVVATLVATGLVQPREGRLHFGEAMQSASREADLLLPEEIAQAIAAAARLGPPGSPPGSPPQSPRDSSARDPAA